MERNRSFLNKMAGAAAGLLLALPAAGLGQDALLDDFEGGTNQNKFLGYWYFYADHEDGGNSEVLSADDNGAALLFKGGYEPGIEGQYSGKLEYKFGSTKPVSTGGDEYNQMVGMGTGMVPEGKTIDLSAASGISMTMKTGGASAIRVIVEVATADVKDHGFYFSTFDVTGTAKTFSLDFNDILNFAQPSWAKQVDWDPTQIQKIQWKISADYATNPTQGTLFVDDIVVKNYSWTPPSACMTCIGAPGNPVGAEFSTMEKTPVNKNAVGYYWYAYNDAEGRNVAAGEFSDIFGGVIADPDDPTLVSLNIEGNGQGTGNGAFIDFQLGPTYEQAGGIIKPFVGVGTKLSDNLGLKFFNGSQTTGIYFDYKTGGDVDWIRLEVKADQDFGNDGIVHHVLLPATKGEWKSANVPWSKLVLPDWEEVAQIPDPSLKLGALDKFQWAFQGNAGDEGSLAVDNVYLTGIEAISISTPYARSGAKDFRFSQLGNRLHVSMSTPDLVRGSLELIGTNGRVAMSEKFDRTKSLVLNTNELEKGFYAVRLHGVDSQGNSIARSSAVTLLP